MLGKLNNYDKTLKKHRGQLSFMSDLESIDEVEFSDHFEQSFFYKQEGEEESKEGPQNAQKDQQLASSQSSPIE